METNTIQKRLAENLRKFRKEKKMTQFDLAVKSDLSEAMIKSIELCKSWPSEKTLLAITAALKIDVYKLFLPLAADLKSQKEIRSSIKKQIAANLRTYIEEQLRVIENS